MCYRTASVKVCTVGGLFFYINLTSAVLILFSACFYPIFLAFNHKLTLHWTEYREILVLKNHKCANCQLLNYHRYSNSTLSRDYCLLLKRVNFCSEAIEKKCLMLSLIKEAELERFQLKKLRAFCHLRTFWGFDCLAVKGNNLETRAENAAPSWGSYNFTNSILAF